MKPYFEGFFYRRFLAAVWKPPLLRSVVRYGFNKHQNIDIFQYINRSIVMEIWDFIQDEILGMKWLNRLIGSFLNACGLDTEDKIGGSIQFFIFD